MPLFHELITNSTSSASLQSFVINNIQRFQDLNNGPYNNIQNEKYDIRDFIELKACYLTDIDFELTQCRAFISILFDFCERFGFICTTRIENTLSRRNLFLGNRREAAKLFLLQVRQDTDYITRFEQICFLLQCSIETEEDTEVKPVVTFLNYLAKVIRDTSEEIINSVRAKVNVYTANNTIPLLQNQVIQEACAIPIIDINSANAHVQSIIESYLGHVYVIEPDIEEIAEEIIIESDTPYFRELVESRISFDRVRRIAIDRCANLRTDLPGRGVAPLRSEIEMFIYLKRYGNMHKSKLLSAFETFPFNELHTPMEIIDWGCGQGLASLVFLDYIREIEMYLNICKIILIEPSELTLKRAALHLNLMQNSIQIKTICNVFNNLSVNEVSTNNNNIKIHLFSNVLDIDEAIFSLSNLIRLIEQSQHGINYFVCVSPYIDDIKTDRLDSFKRHFERSHIESFRLLLEETTTKSVHDNFWLCNNNRNENNISHGIFLNCQNYTEDGGCSNKWTRVIRVFKVVF
jgi:hypothetical protein